MKTTAVIVTLNEEKYLPKLLDSLNNQTSKLDEIIVVDAGSTDKTQEIAQQYGVTLINWHPPVGGQRHKGGELAQGALLFFFDADVIVPNNYISDMVKKFEKSKIAIACPNYVPHPGTFAEMVVFKIINWLFWITQMITPSGGGMGIVVTKNQYDKCGGFKSNYVYDDIEFIRRASKFCKYRFIKEISLKVSDRRFRKYGMTRMITTYVVLSVFFVIGLFKEAEIVRYSFGDYDKISK